MKGSFNREFVRNIVESIWNCDEHLINIDDFVISLLAQRYGFFMANDIWERIRYKVLKEIRRKIESCYSRNLTPKYVFKRDPFKSEKNDCVLVRYDYFLAKRNIGDGKKQRKEIIVKYRSYILETIKSLSSKEFECFGAYLLRLYGAKYCSITKQTSDGGIDFYGFLDFPDKDLGFALLRNTRLILIGQAKKWENNIDINQLKLFWANCKDLNLNEFFSFYSEEVYQCFPIFITTSKFTKGAIKYANRYRIIIKDGEQVVEDFVELLPNKSIEEIFYNRFSRENLLDWLKNELRTVISQ